MTEETTTAPEETTEEAAPETPAETPPAVPKKSPSKLVEGIKRLRAERNALREQLQAKASAPAPEGPQIDAALAKKNPLAALEKIGLSRAEAIELIQQEALTTGALPPAMARVAQEMREQVERQEKIIRELQEQIQAREAEQVYERAVAELRKEASDASKYPELDGYEWAVIEQAAVDAAAYWDKAHPNKKASASDLLSLVNRAFAQHHETVSKRAAKKAPPPPAPPAAVSPPATRKKPELPPVTPAGRPGKVRMPSRAEIRARVEKAVG